MALLDQGSIDKNAEALGKLLEDIDIAMLTTVGPQGYLVSRPLSTRQASFDGERVWFFTEADSPKIGEVRRNPKVNLAYASKDKNTYVSLSGTAKVNRDRGMIEALWNDAMKAFFPGGKDDPNLVLLEVSVRTAEYWDGPSTLIGKLVTFVIARVTRKEEVMGENRLLDLSGSRTTSRLPPSHANARPGARKAARKTLSTQAAGKPSASTGSATKRSAGTKSASKTATRTATTKAASKKAASKKSASRKPASKKAASKKSATTTTAGKSSATKTAATKKAATRKTATSKAATKKSATRKSAGR